MKTRVLVVVILVILVAVFVQIAIVSHIKLLGGNADLVLAILAAWSLQERARSTWIFAAGVGLVVGVISGAPWFIYLFIYMGVAIFARSLTRRIWQAPLLAMFVVTFVGMLFLTMFIYGYRLLVGVNIPFDQAFLMVILPSILMNLMVAMFVFPLISVLAKWLYSEDLL